MVGAAIRLHTSGIARTTELEESFGYLTVPRRTPGAKDSKYIDLGNLWHAARHSKGGSN
jgi:hypothetical protein